MFVVLAISVKLVHRWCIIPLPQKGPISEELAATLTACMLNIQNSNCLRKLIINQFYVKNCPHLPLLLLLFYLQKLNCSL